jgi:hypothetical protein
MVEEYARVNRKNSNSGIGRSTKRHNRTMDDVSRTRRKAELLYSFSWHINTFELSRQHIVGSR